MMYQACMSLWQGNRNSGAAKANSIKFQLFKTKFHGCRPISFCVSVYILIHQVTQGIYNGHASSPEATHQRPPVTDRTASSEKTTTLPPPKTPVARVMRPHRPPRQMRDLAEVWLQLPAAVGVASSKQHSPPECSKQMSHSSPLSWRGVLILDLR